MQDNSRGRPSSLVDEVREEGVGLFHRHAVRLHACLVKQGHPSPGLFLIIAGEALVQKELEVVHTAARHSSGATPQPHDDDPAGAPAASHAVASFHRKAIKPVQVALLGAGDFFGDIGLLDGTIGGSTFTSSSSGEARRSPVTVLSHSARLEVQFISRADLLRVFSKALLRSLRAHSATRAATHAARVQVVLDALGTSVAGRVTGRTDTTGAAAAAAVQAMDRFWAQNSTDDADATNTDLPPAGDLSTTANGPIPQPPATPSNALATISSVPVVASPPVAAVAVAPTSSPTHRSSPSKQLTLSKEERKAKREKDQEALQESLNKRYQNMKLKSQRMCFPESLLGKIRAQVVAASASGLRVTKALGHLLVQPLEPLAADSSEREMKDTFRFYGEALKSAEYKRNMLITAIGDVSSADRSMHMQALLQNDTRNAQNRFEEQQASKLGALDTLLREERARQQKERELLLGTNESSKRAKIPSAHYSSVTPVVGMRMTLSSILAHGPKPLRGAEALLARSEKERRKEEAEMRIVHAQLERSLRHQDASGSWTDRPNTAPQDHALGSARPTNMFAINSGLDTDFLTTSTDKRSITARERPRSRTPHGLAEAGTPTYYESLQRLASSPPSEGSKLLSNVYAPDAFRANPELAITRSQVAAERFGRNMELLPAPPQRPAEWEPPMDVQATEEDEASFAMTAASNGNPEITEQMRAQAQQLMGELLSSPAPPRLHTSAMPSVVARTAKARVRHGQGQASGIDVDVTPRAFAESFHSFSSAMKPPTPRRRPGEEIVPQKIGEAPGSPYVRGPGKSFFPLRKASTPRVLLQAMPSVLPDDNLETPQGILLARARVKAAAELEEAEAAERRRAQPMDAEEAYELERQVAMQVFAQSLESGTYSDPDDSRPGSGRRLGMDKYQPSPVFGVHALAPSHTRPRKDDFLLSQYRVAAWKRPVRRPAGKKHSRSFSTVPQSSRTMSIDLSTVAHELGPPPHARKFAQSVTDKLAQGRERDHQTERARTAALSLPPHRRALAPLHEGHESATSSHAVLPFAATALLPITAPVPDEADRAVTAPAIVPQQTHLDSPSRGGPGSPRSPRPPRAPLDAPKSPRALVRKDAPTAPPPQVQLTIIQPSPRTSKLRFSKGALSDPSMLNIGSNGPVRPRKVGSPPRLVARSIDSDDASLALTPLTYELTSTVRAQLLRAIEERAELMAIEEVNKAAARAAVAAPQGTDMVRFTTAALHVTHKRTEHEEKATSDTSADGGVIGEHLAANVPKLNILDSLPPRAPSPEKGAKLSSRAIDGGATISGTEAAASGRLASSITPLALILRENGLGGMSSGLTAAGQMLPATPSARKLTELYAHFQRHLARSRDYFLEQSVRVQRARAAAAQEALEKQRSADAAAGIIAPISPPHHISHLHRVDSEGYIEGPDRLAPSLAPGSFASSRPPATDSDFDATTTSHFIAPTFESKLSGRDGARRRGGGHLGMLEDQSPTEMNESISVLAEMIAQDSLENEQALRVLNSYDKKQLLYLPTALLQRAQELHRLLDKRLEAEAAAKEALLAGPSLAKPKPVVAEKKPVFSESEEEEEDDETKTAHLTHLRSRARRKAKSKFRLLPGVVDLFSPANTKRQSEHGSSSHLLQDDEVKEETRIVDNEMARRVVHAVSVANRGDNGGGDSESSSRSASAHGRRRSYRSAGGFDISVGGDPRITNAPLPPPFMVLYNSHGLRPVSGKKLGFESSTVRAPPVTTAPGMSLLDIVQARANLERKLRQDHFVAKVGESMGLVAGATDGRLEGDSLAARQKRQRELQILEAEDALERRMSVASGASGTSGVSGLSIFGGGPGSTSSGPTSVLSSPRNLASPHTRAPSFGFALSLPASSIALDDDDDENLDVGNMLATMAAQRAQAKANANLTATSPVEPVATTTETAMA